MSETNGEGESITEIAELKEINQSLGKLSRPTAINFPSSVTSTQWWRVARVPVRGTRVLVFSPLPARFLINDYRIRFRTEIVLTEAWRVPTLALWKSNFRRNCRQSLTGLPRNRGATASP